MWKREEKTRKNIKESSGRRRQRVQIYPHVRAMSFGVSETPNKTSRQPVTRDTSGCHSPVTDTLWKVYIWSKKPALCPALPDSLSLSPMASQITPEKPQRSPTSYLTGTALYVMLSAALLGVSVSCRVLQDVLDTTSCFAQLQEHLLVLPRFWCLGPHMARICVWPLIVFFRYIYFFIKAWNYEDRLLRL